MRFTSALLILCMLIFSNFVTAQNPPEKPATASVSGRITAGDRQVPEVLLTLQSVTQSRQAQRETYNTKSDEDGNFKFTKVKAGRYYLMPNALGYLTKGGNGRSFQQKTIIVNDGESLDQQDIQLTAGGVITGKITDDDGRPIIEQRISLLRKEASGKISRSYIAAFNSGLFFTDDRGVYRMYGLPAGKYVVAVGEDNIYSGTSVSSNFSNRYPFTFYPSVTAEEKAEEVEVSEGGEVENIDIRIGKAKPIFVAKGKIIEATSSQPIVGVRYRLGRLLTDDRNEKRANASVVEAARTNNNGEFIIDGLTPGSYAVGMYSDESSDYYSKQATFEIKESDVNGIEIKAQLGSSINGIVVIEGETSPAILAQLRNLLITCNVANNSVSSPRPKINSDGTFQARAIPSGKARLNVSSYDGKQDFILLRTEKDGVVLPPDGFVVTNNSQISGIKLIVAHGSGSIRGHVNVIGGTIPSGVVMYAAAKQVLTAPANARSSGGQTDPNWRFIIENLIPGDYEITMTLANLPSLPASSPLRAKMVKNVTVKKSSESAVVFTLDLSETGEKQ